MIKLNEIFERKNITDGERRLGCVSVRYPELELKRIDKFYSRLAEGFLMYAEKHSLCGMLQCRVTYEDGESISVITESRLYKDSECIRRHRSSLVWDRKRQLLRYIRKRGIRRCNIAYDGRELSIFN